MSLTTPAADSLPMVADGCPKRMVYGPCGGVGDDGSCEMIRQPCAFVDLEAALDFEDVAGPGMRDVPDHSVRASSLVQAAARRPVVVTDFSARPFDEASVREVASILVGCCDAVLVGEHQNRPDLPPSMLAEVLSRTGLRPWVTLTCRDRNRLVLEQEVAGLLRTDADGVLCVTGDGRAQGVRPGVTQVFDLDGTRLAAIASSAGLCVAVAESPDARPRAIRAARLAQKQRAGAQVAILNHVGSIGALTTFLAAARAQRVTIPIIAAVAVFTDERSAQVLQNFPGLHLDTGRVAAVLASPDPVRAGIASAVDEARAVLSIPGVNGINLSGLGSARGEVAAAEVKASIGAAVLDLIGSSM